jgi:hypothetical protein
MRSAGRRLLANLILLEPRTFERPLAWRSKVWCGSVAGLRHLELGAVELPVKLEDHEADFRGHLVPAMT